MALAIINTDIGEEELAILEDSSSRKEPAEILVVLIA